MQDSPSQGQCTSCGEHNFYSALTCGHCEARLPWADAIEQAQHEARTQTEREQVALAEQAARDLLQSEWFLQSTLNSLSEHIAILDETGTILAVNKAWCHFAADNGAREGTFDTGINYLTICDQATGAAAAEASQVAAGIRAVLAGTQDIFTLEYPCHGPDESRWFIINVTRFEGAGALRVVVSHQNVTQRRQAQEALAQSEERFRQMAEKIGEVFWMCTPNISHILYLSPAFEDVFGYARQDFYEHPELFIESIHPDDKECVGASMQEIEEKGTTELECRILDAEGTVRWVQIRSSAVRDGDGKLQSVVGITRDISERKAAAEELQNFAARLERSNQELQEFAYVASHDLQEPLRKIITFSERIGKDYSDILDERGRDYLARMQNATERMHTLINDLLSLSRVATETKPFQQVQLAAIVQGVLADLEVRIDETDARIEVGALPEIEADAGQMRQLLQNLIGNALKFHRSGHRPVVRIHAAILEDQNLCRLVVEDNGIGFDEQFTERIFMPFHRLHGRSQYEGSGMGLSICRRIVERHGGSISANSRPGEGATFTVLLPIKH